MNGPLANAKEEDFAHAVARGVKIGEAYRRTHPDASKKTSQEIGSRWTRKIKIAARIAQIRKLASDAEAQREKDEAAAASKMLKGTILSMDDRRRLMGQIANDETQDPETRMRAAMNDAKLAGDLIDRSDLTSGGDALPSVMPTIVFNEARPCGRRAKK